MGKRNEKVEKRKFTDRERTALIKVHRVVIKFLDLFMYTEGFIDEEDCYEGKRVYTKLMRTLEMEYIDLYDTVYSSLKELFTTHFQRSVCFVEGMDKKEIMYEDDCEFLRNEYLEIIEPFL